MNDQDAWQRGVRFMEEIHARLPCQGREQLGALLDNYRRYKGEMLTLTAGSHALCRDCGGQCCMNGKYRFNGLDILALLDQQERLPTPDFAQKPLCPYGDAGGCRLEPAFRPLDCVLFICNAIEEVLQEGASGALDLLEQKLRRCVQQAEALLEQPLGRPLLLLGGQQQ
jgi:hypothetical protein